MSPDSTPYTRKGVVGIWGTVHPWNRRKSLKSVLEAHIKKLDRNELISEDVTLLDGDKARFDLMLWTQSPTTTTSFEHLVIELKRPSIKLDQLNWNKFKVCFCCRK